MIVREFYYKKPMHSNVNISKKKTFDSNIKKFKLRRTLVYSKPAIYQNFKAIVKKPFGLRS